MRRPPTDTPGPPAVGALATDDSDRIFRVVVLLMAIGTVFVFSAGTSLSQDYRLETLYRHPGVRQLIYLPLAVLTLWAVSRFDYHHLSLDRGLWRSAAGIGWLLSCLLLGAVLVIGATRGGARRWFVFPAGPIEVSLQPSELAKWMTAFTLAAYCARHDFQLTSFRRHFLPACAVLAVPVGLVLVEDFGTAAFIALLGVLLLLLGGARWSHLLSPLPLAAGLFGVAIFRYPHRVSRLLAFLHPEQYANTVAYQARQSLIALGSGGIWGKGLGRGICKYGGLPEDTTDFVFAIIGEETGLVGTLLVILLFALFLWLGFRVARGAPDGFGRLLALGITLGITLQAALNIGVVTVVLPTKGIPLPFVSGGGTSLLVSAAAVGVLVNIARQGGSPASPSA